MVIFFIILCIIILFYFSKNYENFDIVGYNSTGVPDYKIDSVYDTETYKLENIFTNLNIKNQNYNKDYLNVDPTFTLVNLNLTFPFTNIFKQLIIDYLVKEIPEYKKDKVYILGNLNNIYYKDTNNVRIFVFNFNLVNPRNFFTRNIKIRLKLNNIDLFTSGSSYIDITNDLNKQNVVKFSEIEYILLDKSAYPNFTFNPVDELLDPLYLIKNKYHLMDPFLTSGKEAIITDNMKINFQYILDDKTISLSREFDSYSKKDTNVVPIAAVPIVPIVQQKPQLTSVVPLIPIVPNNILSIPPKIISI